MKKTIIVVEGPDYTGKGTLVENLSDYFSQAVAKFNRTREPGGTPFAEEIRNVLKGPQCKGTSNRTKLAGMFCARFDLCEKVVALGCDVTIFDRHSLSTAAYQIFYSDQTQALDLALFEAMQTQVDKLLENFDIHYILLDVNTEVCAERKKAAQQDRDPRDLDDVIEQTYSNHLKLREAYNKAFEYFSKTERMKSYVRIDTSFMNPQQVFNKAINFILG